MDIWGYLLGELWGKQRHDSESRSRKLRERERPEMTKCAFMSFEMGHRGISNVIVTLSPLSLSLCSAAIRWHYLLLFSFFSRFITSLTWHLFVCSVSVGFLLFSFSTLRAKQTQELTRNWILIRLLLGLLLSGPVLGTVGRDGPIVLSYVQATVLMRGRFRKEFPSLVDGNLLDDAGNA